MVQVIPTANFDKTEHEELSNQILSTILKYLPQIYSSLRVDCVSTSHYDELSISFDTSYLGGYRECDTRSGFRLNIDLTACIGTQTFGRIVISTPPQLPVGEYATNYYDLLGRMSDIMEHERGLIIDTVSDFLHKHKYTIRERIEADKKAWNKPLIAQLSNYKSIPPQDDSSDTVWYNTSNNI